MGTKEVRRRTHHAATNGSFPSSIIWSVLVGVAALVTYLWLAPSAPGDGDSSELTLALARNGVPHPTGYPIYVLAGHVFVAALHQCGVIWVYAANAWSALGGAVAVSFMYALSLRMIPQSAPISARARHVLALVPVALFIFNPLWTDVTALAEVYSWQQAWAMAAAFIFVGAARQIVSYAPVGDLTQSREPRFLRLALGWGALCGLGLSHHLTTVLIGGTLSLALLVLLARERCLSLRLVLIAMAALAVPLLSYVTLLLKASHPSPAVWFRLEPTWPSVVAHVTGEQYHGLLGHFRASASQARTLSRYVYPFLLPGLGLMVLAAFSTKDRREGFVLKSLLLASTVQLAFCLLYGVPDPTTYFLPPLGIALAMLTPAAAGLMTSHPRAQRTIAWAACGAALIAVAQYGNWLGIGVGRRELLVRLDLNVRKIWTALPLERGIVLWGGDLFHRYNAYQMLLGEKPGLRLVSPYELSAPLHREHFRSHFGFDPFGSSDARIVYDHPPSDRGPRYDAYLEATAERLHAATSEPVVVLSPSSDSPMVIGAATSDSHQAATPPFASIPPRVTPPIRQHAAEARPQVASGGD